MTHVYPLLVAQSLGRKLSLWTVSRSAVPYLLKLMSKFIYFVARAFDSSQAVIWSCPWNMTGNYSEPYEMMPTPYSVYAVHAQKAMTRYGTSKDSSLNKWVIGKAFWMGLSMGCLKVKTILLGSSNGRPMEVHEQGSLARTPRQNMTQVN